MTADSHELVLLHNPACSKSRAVKALLDERGLDYALRPYLDQPLDLAELRALVTKLGAAPADLVRTGEPEFAAAGLSARSSDDELLRSIAAHPALMQRPILVRGARARVGRPPEAVLELL